MSRAPALLQPVYNTYRVFPKISNFQQFYFKICTFLQKYCYALNKILAVSGSEKRQTLYWKCVCTIRNRLEARCFVTTKELPALEFVFLLIQCITVCCIYRTTFGYCAPKTLVEKFFFSIFCAKKLKIF